MEMEEELDSLEPFPNEDTLHLENVSDLENHKNAVKLQAVHHAYRKMEKSKRFYHIQTESLMRRQQALLDNLKSENDSLQETVDTYVIKDFRKQMAHCLEEANRYTGLIESESKRLHSLEAVVHDLDAKELDCKSRMGGYMAGWTKHRTTQIHIQQDENRLHKKKRRSEALMKRFTKTHYTMRKKAGVYYKKWVDIKAFADTQDVLKVDKIAKVLPRILELKKNNAELFKHMNNLLKEMEGLDSVKQDHIFDRSSDGDAKSSVAARRYEVDQAVNFLFDSIRHLEMDDEAFIPIVIDMKKQILLVFKEAGCYIKEDEALSADLGQDKSKLPTESQSPELTVGKFFSKLEDFVDRISGTFS